MSGYETEELTEIETHLDALTSPTAEDVWQATRPYDARAIAAVAAKRAGSGGGGNPVLRATITLDDAQIKTLPTTFVEIVPGPGAGSALLLLGAFVGPLSGVAYTYDATAGVFVVYGSRTYGEQASQTLPLSTGLLDATGVTGEIGTEAQFNGGWSHTASLEDQPLVVGASNGGGHPDFGGGGGANALPFTVIYAVVPWT